MKLFYEWLQEARKNPELNPKIGRIEALRPYKDRQDCFISFTEINKLGINPLNLYDTPVAIYAYPLKQIWNQIEDDIIPFASDRQYIKLFSCSHPKLQETVDYGKGELKRDLFNLEELFLKKYPKGKFKKELGQYLEKELINEFNNIKNISFSTAFPSTDFRKFWFFTKNLSQFISNNRKTKIDNKIAKQKFISTKGANIWNTILIDLGYIGFTDRSGEGNIHINEPIQAMFLSKKHIKHIDSIPNKKYEEEVTSKMKFENMNEFIQQFKKLEELKLFKTNYLNIILKDILKHSKTIQLNIKDKTLEFKNEINTFPTEEKYYIKFIEYFENSKVFMDQEKCLEISDWEELLFEKEYSNINLITILLEWYIENSKFYKNTIVLENILYLVEDILEDVPSKITNDVLSEIILKRLEKIKFYIQDKTLL